MRSVTKVSDLQFRYKMWNEIADDFSKLGWELLAKGEYIKAGHMADRCRERREWANDCFRMMMGLPPEHKIVELMLGKVEDVVLD